LILAEVCFGGYRSVLGICLPSADHRSSMGSIRMLGLYYNSSAGLTTFQSNLLPLDIQDYPYIHSIMCLAFLVILSASILPAMLRAMPVPVQEDLATRTLKTLLREYGLNDDMVL
jgi:hypothetical protein